MHIQFVGQMATAGPLLTTDIRDLHLVTLETATFLYTLTPSGGGLAAYRVSQDGSLATLQDTLYFTPDITEWAGPNLTPVPGVGGTELIYGSRGALRSVALEDDGMLADTPGAMALPGAPGNVSTAVFLEGTSQTFCYAANTTTGQLQAYVVSDQGGATGIEMQAQALPDFSGSALLQTVTSGAGQFLLLADAGAQGVTSFRVDADTGVLSETDRLGASEGLGINAPSAMEVVSAFGQTFVVVGAYGSSALSVMRLTDQGELVACEHVMDTLATRFGGLQSLASVSVDGHSFVVAGGADDGLSMFSLLPDGRLVHVQTLTHWSGGVLENVGEIAAARVGDQLQLFVTSATSNSLAQFSVSLETLGAVLRSSTAATNRLIGTEQDELLVAEGTGGTTLIGAAGNDTLVAGPGGTVLDGGAGADRFVLSAQAPEQIIQDFERGQDQLDLSAFEFLRTPAQLMVIATETGATLTFGDISVSLISADAQPLDLSALFGGAFSWPDRVLVLANGSGQEIWAGKNGGFLRGSERDDTMTGAAGADNLWSQAGNDVLFGGQGEDTLGGGAGADTLWGGAGEDIVFGGAGPDSLRGGDQADALWGGTGDDMILGGTGNDSLGGSLDNDTLWGGAGDDLMFGDIGQDVLFGESGADTLWAGTEADISHGGAGADVLGGGLGQDTLLGDAGFDLLYGGGGSDSLSGGDGMDTLFAGDGNDTLSGDTGDDSLSGGLGNDSLSGGDGLDLFGFAPHQGDDVITDFQVGTDLVHLFGAGDHFDSLTFTQDGAGHAVLVLGSGQVTFLDVSTADLSADQFVFL